MLIKRYIKPFKAISCMPGTSTTVYELGDCFISIRKSRHCYFSNMKNKTIINKILPAAVFDERIGITRARGITQCVAAALT